MTWHRLLRHFRSVKDCRDRNNVVEDLDERCSLPATVIDEPKWGMTEGWYLSV